MSTSFQILITATSTTGTIFFGTMVDRGGQLFQDFWPLIVIFIGFLLALWFSGGIRRAVLKAVRDL